MVRERVRVHKLCRGFLMAQAPDHCCCSTNSFSFARDHPGFMLRSVVGAVAANMMLVALSRCGRKRRIPHDRMLYR